MLRNNKALTKTGKATPKSGALAVGVSSQGEFRVQQNSPAHRQLQSCY